MGKKYLRMTLNERLQHINLFINFTILVITGFALSFPTAFWATPITEIPAGMTLRGFLHRLSGVAIVFLGGYHLLYCSFTKRGRGIIKDMIPTWKDTVDLLETLKNNLFINRPPKVIKMGRFNFREKFEYFGLIWGTLVMTITGFILWFEVEWLKYFPQWTYNLARTIHFYEAVLATLTILVWHFYSVIFNPDVYPMNWAWITGELTEHEMEMEHGLELEKIKAEEKGRLVEFEEAVRVGGGKVYPLYPKGEERAFGSIKRLYSIVQSLNETIKSWRGA
ncbi:MAG: formate dehydrogenase subunit gamma [Thermodesulfobacteriota bacterium]